MELNLEGKSALVTGSTEGIGLAIAKSLAQEGVTVYINGRTQDRVQKAINLLKQEKIDQRLLKEAVFDLSTAEGASALTQTINTIDILVNNVGIYQLKPFTEITDEEWLHLFEVNVMSGIRLSRFFFPKMLEKNWGRVIFISSESGVNAPKEMIHYGMTKSAQLSVSRGLAELTKGGAVTVNSILPGPTLSPGVEKFVEDVAQSKGINSKEAEKLFFKEDRSSSLLQRFATAEEVADLVTFVCSSKAAAINGAALRVEGGIIQSIF